MAPNIFTLGVTLMLVTSTLAHVGDYKSPISSFQDSVYPHPRILLLGGTGTGKSSVGNVLLGRSAQAKPEKFASKRCFHAGKGNDAVTIESCADVGYWLGDPEKKVTIIDTPGFGDATPEKDGNTTEFLINLLKTEIKFIDAFVFFFNGKAARFTWSMRSMLKQFENMFGEDFWNNVIFEVTFWSYAESNIRIRNINDETEKSFTQGRNKKFKEEFGVKRDIESVFIHPLYNENDPKEKEEFVKYTTKLWDFAAEKTPFACNDIKAVLAEIQAYIIATKKLEQEKRDLQKEIDGLTCEPCDEPVPDPVQNLPQKGMSKSQVAGLGFGMVLLGLLIGVAITFFLKSQDNVEDTPKEQEFSQVLTSTGEEE